jgi:hypothetical protein
VLCHTFDKKSWCELLLEVQKLFNIFGVVRDSQLRDDGPHLVNNELKKQKIKHGLSTD